MKRCIKSLAVGALFIVGSSTSLAATPIGAGMLASGAQHVQPGAPMVTCTVRMNFWCIVQADAGLNMTDAGDYRTWKMLASGSKREVVTIRESKNCDSPADLRLRKRVEKETRLASGERQRTVELAVSADGACTLKVEYFVGDSDLAREATQMAKYRLYLCEGGLCRRPLLQ